MNLEVLPYRNEPGRFDEAIGADGEIRHPWATLARALGTPAPGVFAERQRHADRLLDAEGAGHLVHDLALHRHSDRRSTEVVDVADVTQSRPWRLDPVPFVLAHDEFTTLAAAATQRMRFLELLLADLGGRRSLVRSGVVPASTLFSLPGFRPVADAAPGDGQVVSPPNEPTQHGRWLVHYALDVVRDADGFWRVVQDQVDAPSGMGYTLLNRAVLARLIPESLRIAGAAPIHEHADVLRHALTAAAPPQRRSPRCVVLTSGPAHPTYVEHSYLATQLGYHLAEGADLVMRQGRLWLRALDGLEPIDVVYRRMEDAALDPLEPHHEGGGCGVPGLVWGARRGGVSLANAYGSAVGEDHLLRALFDDAAAVLLGEPLLLGQLPPGASLASAPVFAQGSHGELTPAAVVLRLQLVATPEGISVMPGAAGLVLATHDDPSLPTTQLVKDVWVVGGPSVAARLPLRVASPPQVDFGTSVPKRAADSLYWLGRAAERAEVAARAARVVSAQLDQDPMLATVGDGGWASGVCALLRAAQGLPQTAAEERQPIRDRVDRELRAASGVAADQLALLVQEAASVREFLSTTTGRVLGRLARTRADLLRVDAAADDLDIVLVDLAALAGLATESTVRGPAWRFLDLGRRLERALAVLGAVEAALGPRVDPFAFQPLAEVVLSANESLVAYRRRYRSDVDLDAVIDLLVHDDANPRSLAYQLDRLREHVAALAWSDGAELVRRASVGALTVIDSGVVGGRRLTVDSLVLAVRGPLLELSDAIVRRWFADPVNPIVVRGW